MSNFREIKSLPLELPEKEIFLRLGGNLFKTHLDSDSRIFFQQTSLKAFELCVPCGRWGIAGVQKVTEEGVCCEDGDFIEGAAFAAKNPGITHLWYGAVTLGGNWKKKFDSLSDTAEKTIYDAVGSECADAAMDLLFRMSGTFLRSRGIILASHRYSPGYGDMPLKMQKFFFRKLHLNEVGMDLTETFFLTPEKSVTAFAGGTVDIR